MQLIKTICTLVAAAAIGIAACDKPSIEKIKDLTGDGIPDMVITANSSYYLFIGRKDGSYERAECKHDYEKPWFSCTTINNDTLYLMDEELK